jgi:pimeloyl-ACP methyl ester carboxylesterase
MTASIPMAPRPIFIHGSGAGPPSWGRQQPSFEGAELLRLPGHDGAPGPALAEVAAYADWVAGRLGAIEGPRALVGHSLGGAIAMELALRRPELVDGLVLICTGARLPVPEEALALVERDFAAACERLVRRSYVDPDEETIAAGMALLASAGQATLLADYTACAAFDARERLAAVRVPALVVSAAEDTLTPPWLGEELARALPMARMVVVEEASHMVISERPDVVNLLVAAYLARLELTLDGPP